MSGERRAESGEQKITQWRAPNFEFLGNIRIFPKHLASLRILLVKITKFRHVDELQPVIYFQFQGIMMQDLVLLMKELVSSNLREVLTERLGTETLCNDG